MDEKKYVVYDSDVMALPPLRLVLGDVPSPDPDRRNQSNQQPFTRRTGTSKSNFEKQGTVKRIIARLEKD
ncbi:MAG: hypothetical protein WCE68_06535 [Anaerolineales bacterium]